MGFNNILIKWILIHFYLFFTFFIKFLYIFYNQIIFRCWLFFPIRFVDLLSKYAVYPFVTILLLAFIINTFLKNIDWNSFQISLSTYTNLLPSCLLSSTLFFLEFTIIVFNCLHLNDEKIVWMMLLSGSWFCL